MQGNSDVLLFLFCNYSRPFNFSSWIRSVTSLPMDSQNNDYVFTGPDTPLRSLFRRLAVILTMPVHAIFIFDGPARPRLKGQQQVSSQFQGLVQELCEFLEAFGFQWREVKPCHIFDSILLVD